MDLKPVNLAWCVIPENLGKSDADLCNLVTSVVQSGMDDDFCHFYAQKQLLLSAHLSHRNSVHLSVRLSVLPSVTRVDQSIMVQARVTKFLPSAAWKTLVLGTVKLFHKFEGGHLERGC